MFITDATSRREITSYRVEGAPSLRIDLVPLPATEVRMHDEIARVFQRNASVLRSHTVVIVDHSASMRTNDVPGFGSRFDAVFSTIALDLIGKPLDHGCYSGHPQDVMTLIEMQDDAQCRFTREPITNVLFNRVVELRNTSRPRSHGNYIPALELARQVIEDDIGNNMCSVLVLFLSDGKPSDQQRKGVSRSFMFGLPVFEIARHFGSRLAFGTIGFAADGADFEVLQEMASMASLAGQCYFVHCSA